MRFKGFYGIVIAAMIAGCVTGVFGAGGGMVLVPCLSAFGQLKEDAVFPASLSVMLPICLISLLMSSMYTPLPWQEGFPYVIGGAIGGVLAGCFGKYIPVLWLHRILGALILWGGIRQLCF